MICVSKFLIYTPVLNFISKGHQGDELTLVAACRDVLRVEVDHILTYNRHYDAFN